MVTPDILSNLPIGTVLHSTTTLSIDNQPMRCRTSGRCRIPKRHPNEWVQPVKWGLKTSFTITQTNAHEWALPNTAS
jgi:hypothetical protein